MPLESRLDWLPFLFPHQSFTALAKPGIAAARSSLATPEPGVRVVPEVIGCAQVWRVDRPRAGGQGRADDLRVVGVVQTLLALELGAHDVLDLVHVVVAPGLEQGLLVGRAVDCVIECGLIRFAVLRRELANPVSLLVAVLGRVVHAACNGGCLRATGGVLDQAVKPAHVRVADIAVVALHVIPGWAIGHAKMFVGLAHCRTKLRRLPQQAVAHGQSFAGLRVRLVELKLGGEVGVPAGQLVLVLQVAALLAVLIHLPLLQRSLVLHGVLIGPVVLLHGVLPALVRFAGRLVGLVGIPASTNNLSAR